MQWIEMSVVIGNIYNDLCQLLFLFVLLQLMQLIMQQGLVFEAMTKMEQHVGI